ncbi:MAG: hypothetical protein Sylvanvirus8_1, partial [Sylvanvirus sp.]
MNDRDTMKERVISTDEKDEKGNDNYHMDNDLSKDHNNLRNFPKHPMNSQSTRLEVHDILRRYTLNALDQKAKEAYKESRGYIVSVVGCILEQLFSPKSTDVLPHESKLTLFHAIHPPSISISAYLTRIVNYVNCSSEAIIQSLIHINRILHHVPPFVIHSFNIHRLVLTSLLCSTKFFDDRCCTNKHFANVGGIYTKELNLLEVEFLALINFDLFVTFSVY